MVRKAISFFGAVATCALFGCQSGSADGVARLQEQLLRMGQQLNEIKKQVDGLQEANQRTTKALFDLEDSVKQFNAGTPAPTPSHPVAIASKPANPIKGEPALLAKQEERATPPKAPVTTVAQSTTVKATSPAASARQAKPNAVFVSKPPPRTESGPNKVVAPVPSPSLGADDLKPATPKQVASADTLCGRIWKQLNVGKDHEEVARSLGVAVSYVAACERRGGQSSGR